MKKTILTTGVKILHYQSFGSQRMRIENPYLNKYKQCLKPIIL